MVVATAFVCPNTGSVETFDSVVFCPPNTNAELTDEAVVTGAFCWPNIDGAVLLAGAEFCIPNTEGPVPPAGAEFCLPKANSSVVEVVVGFWPNANTDELPLLGAEALFAPNWKSDEDVLAAVCPTLNGAFFNAGSPASSSLPLLVGEVEGAVF